MSRKKQTLVAIYVRLSQEDRFKLNKDDDSESIKNQIALLSSKCSENNWEVFDIYIDDDFSGSDNDRPAFNQMINAAREKKFDIVLCKTQSRFARDIEIIEKYINYLFPIWGIRFMSVVDNADTSVKANRKARQITGLIDQWYLEDLSENIRQTLSVKRKQGQFVGAFAPYGYLKDPNDKHHLIVDVEAAEVVKYIYDLYLSGYGVNSITKRLNDEKILNPAAYKKSKGLPFQKYRSSDYSKLWHTYTVRSILQNQVYIGNLVQHKAENVSYKSNKKRQIPKEQWDIVPDTHEAIINNEVFKKVQEIFKNRTRATSFKNSGKRSLFSYKLRCMNCGSSMRLWKSQKQVFYRCNIKYISPESCEGAYISEKVLSEKVIEQIKKLFQSYVDNDFVVSNLINDSNNSRIDLLHNTLTKSENELLKVNKRLKQIYFDKADGVISTELFNELSNDCHREKEKLNITIDNIKKELQSLVEKINDTKDFYKLVEKYKNIEVLDRETISELIDYVEVGGTRNNRLINIHWSF